MTEIAFTSARRNLVESPLLAAVRGDTPSHNPVWFMRQAGRSLPEYRAARAGIPMLTACFTPELICEITLQPVRRHNVDAAILFSDIVVPLRAAGIDVDIVPNVGPVIASPVRSVTDVNALPILDVGQVQPVIDAVRLITAELKNTPLIGFAGAPFTLASYLIEGGPSRNHEHTKSFMRSEPHAWHMLLDRLADITLCFLRAQINAGVDVVQLFDSWAGALSERDYRQFVLPHSRKVLADLAEADVPRIHFGVGTGELLVAMRVAGADVVGVDWRTPLDVANQRLVAAAPDLPAPVLQGNLDPALLFADWSVVDGEVRRILAEGAIARGHVFNLGHGVLPSTDPDMLTRVTELVHSIPITRN